MEQNVMGMVGDGVVGRHEMKFSSPLITSKQRNKKLFFK